MKRILGWLAAHRFVRHNLIFFTGSMVTAVINYLYYPVLGRLLSLSAFGDVQVLLSIFTQIAIFYSALGMATTNIAANTADEKQRNLIVSELKNLGLWIMLGISALSLALAESIKVFLNLGDVRALLALIVSLALTVPLTLGIAYLQGRQRFGEISLINIWSAAARLTLAVGLVLLGWSAFGAIAGLTIAQATTWIFVTARLRRAGYFPVRGRGLRRIDSAILKPELRYAGLVLIVSLATALLYSGDIIVIKHYFSPTQAGLYAGIAAISRIIYFISAPIGVVMFSALKISGAARENRRVLLFSAGLTAILGGVTLLAFWLAPQMIIGALVGRRYISVAYLLPRLGLAMYLVSALNLLFLYCLALRRSVVAAIAVLGCALTLGLVLLWHGSPAAVINGLTAGLLSTLVIFAARLKLPYLTNR
jgi:O-antigen/teichoic acid export membrane protein